MVQRYDLKEDWVTGHIDLEKDADGDWVDYEDYKELDDYYQERLADADEEIEVLVARLAEVNAELLKYKDQFPDYVECANCGFQNGKAVNLGEFKTQERAAIANRLFNYWKSLGYDDIPTKPQRRQYIWRHK